MKSLEEFIKDNSSIVPVAPKNELKKILDSIEKQKPWYQKFYYWQHALVPLMSIVLIVALSFSLQQPHPSMNNNQIDNYITDAFDIYDTTAEMGLID